jgi:hypothetical protein
MAQFGGSGQLDVFETDIDCGGILYGPYNRDSVATWSTSDSSIATVSGGSCTLVAPGNCTITASFFATVYEAPKLPTHDRKPRRRLQRDRKAHDQWTKQLVVFCESESCGVCDENHVDGFACWRQLLHLDNSRWVRQGEFR